MTKILLILLVVGFLGAVMNVEAQFLTCAESALEGNVICGLDTLDNFMSSTPDFPNIGDGPDPNESQSLCPTGGAANNLSWWSFVAGNNTIEVELIISDCQGASGPGGVFIGVQYGVYEDCGVWDEAVVCNPGCTGDGVYPLTMNDLIIGEVYHFFLDGCDGDICNYSINVISGGEPAPELIGPMTINGTPPGGTLDVCRSPEAFQLTTEESNLGDATFEWDIDGQVINSETNNFTDYVFDQTGVVQVCVATDFICSDDENQICINVNVVQEPDETFDLFLCEGEVFTIPGYTNADGSAIVVDESQAPQTTLSDVINAGNCFINLEVNIDFYNENDENPTQIDTALCASDGPFTLADGSTTTTCLATDLMVMTAEGCDSFLSYDIVFLDGELSQVGDVQCVNNSYTITTMFEVSDPACPPSTVSYQWVDADNNPLPGETNPILSVVLADDPETFVLTATMELFGTLCEIDPLVITIDPANFRPPTPTEINGPESVCAGDVATFSVMDLGADITSYQWSIPPGATFVGNQFGNEITVDFTNAIASQVCLLAAENLCGSFIGDPVCLDVEIIFPPVADAGIDRQICGDTETMSGLQQGDSGGWTVVSGPGTAVFTDVNSATSDVTVDAFGTYIFQWEVFNGSCSNTDEVLIDFVQPLETTVPEANCSGGTIYTVEFEISGGVAPFTVVEGGGSIDEDGLYVSGAFTSGDMFRIVIEGSGPCPELVIEDQGPLCQCDTEAGVMDTIDLVLCDGDLAVGNILENPISDGDDTTVWILHDNPGFTLGQILDSNQTGEFLFDPTDMTFGTPYFISIVIGTDSLNDGTVNLNDVCLGVAPGQQVTWYAFPESDAGVDTGTCNMDIQLNPATSAGLGTWSVIDGPEGLIFDNVNMPGATASVSVPGIYQLQWLEDNNGCLDSSTIFVEFYENPEIVNLGTECNEASDSFTVSFQIVGGVGPYTILPEGIDISSDVYTSTFFAQNELVEFTVRDANGCEFTVEDVTDDCICISQVGVLPDIDTTILCEEDIVFATGYDPSIQVYDEDDTTNFVLHQGNDSTIIDPVGQNSTGAFGFDPNTMTFGEAYLISAVVGDDFGGLGVVSLADGCLSISSSQVVVWQENPIADLPLLVTTCEEDFPLAAEDPSPNTGTWSYIDGPSAVTIADLSDPTSATSGSTVPGLYRFLWEVSNGACSVSDTLRVELLGSPMVDVDELVYSCDANNENYTVEFEITGGDPASYEIISAVGGTLSGSSYTSNPIVSGTQLDIQVTDDNGCDTFAFVASFECPCESQAGDMESGVLDFCEDEIAIGDYDPASENLDGNDVVSYILKTSNDNSLNGVLAVSTIPEFAFDLLNYSYETVYYIIAIAGNDAGMGLVDTSAGSCFGIGSPQGVQWFQTPQPDIDAGTTELTCDNPTTTLTSIDNLGLNLSYLWIASDGGVIEGSNTNASVTISSAGTYTLQVTNGPCLASTSIAITFDGDLPNADAGQDQVLTCLETSVTLDGSASDQGAEFEYQWTDENGDVVGDQITVSVSNPGTYTLRVLNTDTGCPGTSQVMVTEEINEPTVTISSVGELTCQSDSTTIDGAGSDAGNGFSAIWTTTTGNIISDATSLQVVVDQAGDYTLTITDQSNGCTASETVSVLEIGNTFSNFEVTSFDLSCFGEGDGEINVSIEGGVAPVEYSIDGGASFQSSGVFNNLAAGQYSVLVRDANGCELGQSVTIAEPPFLEVILPPDTVIELGETIRLLPVNSIFGDGLQFEWTTSGDTNFVCEDTMRCDQILATPVLSSTYTLTVTNATGCTATDDVFVRVQVNRQFYLPNVFSPNDDGVNDFFSGFGGETIERISDLKIFDRWGNMVYDAQNIPPNDPEVYGWDGTDNGQDSPSGVYVYSATVLFRDGFERKIFGDITLIR